MSTFTTLPPNPHLRHLKQLRFLVNLSIFFVGFCLNSNLIFYSIMKALVYQDESNVKVVDDAKEPPLRPDYVKVKVAAVALNPSMSSIQKVRCD